MNFHDYMLDISVSKNIELSNFDLQWLHKQMKLIPVDLRRNVMHSYIDVWAKEMAECDRSIARMNAGRRTANIWLREYIDERNNQIL